MPARTVEQQQDATCFAVVFICLLIAIISNIQYAETNSQGVKNKCKDWFIPCYSIAGIFIFVQILKKICEQKNRAESVPV